MNPTELRQAASVMLAHADAQEKQGRENPTGFQLRVIGESWTDSIGNLRWDWANYAYRQKPAPVLKPWSSGEGLGKVVREKATGDIRLVTGFSGGSYSINGPQTQATPPYFLSHYETWDAATQTAGPCGTLEP